MQETRKHAWACNAVATAFLAVGMAAAHHGFNGVALLASLLALKYGLTGFLVFLRLAKGASR